MPDWQTVIREQDFPMLDRAEGADRPYCYLDNAATTQLPVPVQQSMERYYRQLRANVHRGVYRQGERATVALEETRQLTARFLGVLPEEIIFTSGATDAINQLADAFALSELKPGDLVLATEMEHHSNLLPWLEACRRTGAELHLISVTETGELDLEEYERLLLRRPKLVAFCAVSNVLGTVNPVCMICEMAHDAGAAVLVDAAQAMRHALPELRAADSDFLCFSAHKLMGPTGVGVLYGKAEWLERLPPARYGGGMVQSAIWPEADYEVYPQKFEAGTPNLAGIAGLGAALEYLEGVGLDRVAQREQALLRLTEERLRGIKDIQILGAPKKQAGVVSFYSPVLSAYDFAFMLDKLGVAVRSGRHCAQPLHERFGLRGTVRVSPAFYNTEAEIERLAEALGRILDAARKIGTARHG